MSSLWYRHATIYQIDPSLFRDGNGDGCGDLQGVTSRLEYVRGLGVDCVWLLPIYGSPYRDGGYDVTDHLTVDPRFGDLADFVALMDRADELGLRVMVDLVVQHTSDQHPWFQEARHDPTSPRRDYYVWTDDPEHDPATREPVFPTVQESVWSWDEAAGQFYRHMFYDHEPDLNLANPQVFDEICRIISFWLRLGVSAFRVDAVPYMVERAAQRDGGRYRNGDGMWLLSEMREYVMRRNPDAVLMGEADLPDAEYADYFGRDDRLQLLLNFPANNGLWLALARQQAGPLADRFRSLPAPPRHAAYANFMRNHDELDLERLTADEQQEVLDVFAPEEWMEEYGRGIRRRLAPMLGGDDDRVAMVHALLMSLPGVPVLLFGDEIGMGDDPERPERAAVRTPMQWTDTGGFSAAPTETWVTRPVPDEDFGPKARNVYAQLLQRDSLLARVSHLIRIRAGVREIAAGTCEVLDVDAPSVLAIRHRLDGSGADPGTTLVMLTNLGRDEVRVDLPGEDLDDLVDVLADQQYEPPAGARGLRLAGSGYRWLRPPLTDAGASRSGTDSRRLEQHPRRRVRQPLDDAIERPVHAAAVVAASGLSGHLGTSGVCRVSCLQERRGRSRVHVRRAIPREGWGQDGQMEATVAATVRPWVRPAQATAARRSTPR